MERNLTMRILLIDDEPIALTKLELMLTHVGTCDTVASGIAATECFVKAIDDNQPYDLITIDIELPDITGLDLLTAGTKKRHHTGQENHGHCAQ